MEATDAEPRDSSWTIAYRNPRANHFKRVTNWSGTWRQAVDLAGKFSQRYPVFQVFYVPTLCDDDENTILTECGRRVAIRETGVLDASLINPPAPDYEQRIHTVIRDLGSEIDRIQFQPRRDVQHIARLSHQLAALEAVAGVEYVDGRHFGRADGDGELRAIADPDGEVQVR